MKRPRTPTNPLGAGQKGYQPTDKDRATVKAMVGYGLKHDDIATAIGISDVTLRRHYAPEIATGAITANAQVAQSLFNAATRDGNMTAAIWWTKTRMGWKETVRVGGEDGGAIVFQIATGVPRNTGD